MVAGYSANGQRFSHAPQSERLFSRLAQYEESERRNAERLGGGALVYTELTELTRRAGNSASTAIRSVLVDVDFAAVIEVVVAVLEAPSHFSFPHEPSSHPKRMLVARDPALRTEVAAGAAIEVVGREIQALGSAARVVARGQSSRVSAAAENARQSRRTLDSTAPRNCWHHTGDRFRSRRRRRDCSRRCAWSCPPNTTFGIHRIGKTIRRRTPCGHLPRAGTRSRRLRSCRCRSRSSFGNGMRRPGMCHRNWAFGGDAESTAAALARFGHGFTAVADEARHSRTADRRIRRAPRDRRTPRPIPLRRGQFRASRRIATLPCPTRVIGSPRRAMADGEDVDQGFVDDWMRSWTARTRRGLRSFRMGGEKCLRQVACASQAVVASACTSASMRSTWDSGISVPEADSRSCVSRMPIARDASPPRSAERALARSSTSRSRLGDGSSTATRPIRGRAYARRGNGLRRRHSRKVLDARGRYDGRELRERGRRYGLRLLDLRTLGVLFDARRQRLAMFDQPVSEANRHDRRRHEEALRSPRSCPCRQRGSPSQRYRCLSRPDRAIRGCAPRRLPAPFALAGAKQRALEVALLCFVSGVKSSELKVALSRASSGEADARKCFAARPQSRGDGAGGNGEDLG